MALERITAILARREKRELDAMGGEEEGQEEEEDKNGEGEQEEEENEGEEDTEEKRREKIHEGKKFKSKFNLAHTYLENDNSGGITLTWYYQWWYYPDMWWYYPDMWWYYPDMVLPEVVLPGHGITIRGITRGGITITQKPLDGSWQVLSSSMFMFIEDSRSGLLDRQAPRTANQWQRAIVMLNRNEGYY
ncbi:hypothetical protein GGU11DRAFT_761279 [Lentinula aff. detonsa]|nr:hypothetical protein GGU11DRAFT_761279 [Lentinula aff. detonsa]